MKNKKNRETAGAAEMVSSLSPKTILYIMMLLVFVVGFFAGAYLAPKMGLGPRVEVSEMSEKAAKLMVGNYNIVPALKKIGVDEKKVKKCIDDGKYAKKVNEQLQEGAKAGIRGTPGGVLYDMKTGKKVAFPGAVPYESLVQLLNDLKGGKNDDKAPNVQKPDPKNDHWSGDVNARYVLVEYSDFECPFCKRFHPGAKKFVEENKEVAWVYRHFPLRNLHPDAQKLAEASECVTELKGEDAFWQFVDAMFSGLVNKE